MNQTPQLRLLLDEHYPATLAQSLREAGIDTVSIVEERPDLLGATDSIVLLAATAEGRAVVTEDVSTFSVAITQVPGHSGVLYCRSKVFRRTPPGLMKLKRALIVLASYPPAGLGVEPLVWWLASPDT
ncbi:MAG: DUF5615 family PIN-like protein [Bifidobacteriaceae bacterium]|jgi:hypothetical protein|nr:DUF5615 family PIN-like protein [Bifidobacteriaceae bacterium]